MGKTKYQTLNLLLNLLAALTVALLLSLAIYVNVTHPVVGKVSTPGFPALDINASRWNIACAVLGTAVGILVTGALAFHDGLLTREAILSNKGVVPFYLRPLTIPRAISQAKKGWHHVTRMLLLLFTIVATLSTTATVAIFGVHNVDKLLLNPSASWPLATILGSTSYVSGNEGLIDAYTTATLDSFLFKIAYIDALKLKGWYNPKDLKAWLPESGTLGDTLYPSLRTGGIGLNTSSYVDYSGYPRSGFNVPATYTFNELHGTVFGTHIDVKCTEAAHHSKSTTAEPEWGGDSTWYYQIDTQKGVHFSLFGELDTLIIASALLNVTGSPILTIAITDMDDVHVSECTYSGRDYLVPVSLDSRVSPLRSLADTKNGSFIDDDTKWILAEFMNNLLSLQNGGSLNRAWQSAHFDALYTAGYNGSITSLLENIFGQTGEALISIRRQYFENAEHSEAHILGPGSAITMSVTIAKLGGGSWPWLSVYILLLIGPLLSILHSCKRNQILQYDVQDPVGILELTLPETIDGQSRIRFKDRLEVISSNERSPPTEDTVVT